MAKKKKKYKTSKEALEEVINIAEAFGWKVAFLREHPDSEVIPGLIMGSDEYIDDVLQGKYKRQEDEKPS